MYCNEIIFLKNKKTKKIVPLLRVIYHLWCYHQIWFTLRNWSQKMESKMVGFEPGSASSVIWTIPLKRKKFCFAKTDEIFCLRCISIWLRKVSQIIGLLQGGQVGLEKQTLKKNVKKAFGSGPGLFCTGLIWNHHLLHCSCHSHILKFSLSLLI